MNGVWSYYRSSDHDGRDEHGDDHTMRDGCHRAPGSWARQSFLPDNTSRTVGSRADSFDPTLDYHMSACAGATTRNLLPGGSGQYQEGQQPDQGFLDQYTTLITFSAGGNDARFTGIFKQCIASITVCQDQVFENDGEPLSTAEPKKIDQIGPALQTVLSSLRDPRRAPNAKILVMGYPVLLELDGECFPGIGTPEAPWINEMNNRLDDVLRTAVANSRAAGIPATWADPRPAFAGRGACADDRAGAPSGTELLHRSVLTLTRGDAPALVSQQTLHPTVQGAQVYAQVATAAISGM
ncbi:SGNH/GDSL hydrolase family protein [Amycolatopsis sp. NPDC026612]|uniref:SGNH/GDSL hydrolase family protein n=1 Tax=Amycolatopsis sp. NPDC026612 TaxID=3155466 RepID=UPI0033D697EC